MEGLPKFYATRADFDNVRAEFGDDVYKAEIQKHYDSRMVWFDVMDITTTNEIDLVTGMPIITQTPHTVASVADGITDATHKVVESGAMEEQPTFVQQELKADPAAWIYRVGYTDDEIVKILGM